MLLLSKNCRFTWQTWNLNNNNHDTCLPVYYKKKTKSGNRQTSNKNIVCNSTPTHTKQIISILALIKDALNKTNTQVECEIFCFKKRNPKLWLEVEQKLIIWLIWLSTIHIIRKYKNAWNLPRSMYCRLLFERYEPDLI